jgi:hypothetical protein
MVLDWLKRGGRSRKNRRSRRRNNSRRRRSVRGGGGDPSPKMDPSNPSGMLSRRV